MPIDARAADPPLPAASESTTAHLDLVARLEEQFACTTSDVAIGGRTYRLLHPRSADELIDEEAFNRDGRIPYWAEVWISSQVLAAEVARLSGRGRRLLELGCGIGLPSLAAVAAGFDVTASDYYPEALHFVRANALRSGLAAPATRMVDWRDVPGDLGRFDLVIAADVLYEPPNAGLLAGVIRQSLAEDGYALVADPERARAAAFPAACRQAGLSVEQYGVAVKGQAGSQTIQVYRVARGPRSPGSAIADTATSAAPLVVSPQGA